MRHRRIFLLFSLIWLIGIGSVSFLTVNLYEKATQVNQDCKSQTSNPAEFSTGKFDALPYLVTSGFKDVRLKSRTDQVDIAAWYIPAEDKENTTRTIIIVHGSGGCRHDTGNLVVAGMLHRNGYNALVIDLREFGDSDVSDGQHSGGALEYLDVLGAWDWLIETKGFSPDSIGLWGISFGAGVNAVAAGEEPQIAAVFLDSYFPSLYIHIRDDLAEQNWPTFLADTSLWYGDLFGDANLHNPNPRDSMQKFGERPAYIVHGGNDTNIPPSYAEELADIIRANGGTVVVWIEPDVPHGGVMSRFLDEYETRLVNFFDQTLAKNAP